MATRPAIRAATSQLRNVRNLHMTGPATYSSILTETRTATPDANPTDATKRPTASSAGASSKAERHFNTSRSLKAVGDTSTIDFAYLPELEHSGSEGPGSARVPLLLGSMYSGNTARAMHEDTPEEILRPMINLISHSSTYIGAPSAMSEVHDNSSVDFQGLRSIVGGSEEAGKGPEGAVKQFFNDLLEDIVPGGKKKN
ncbi:hypothetical protein BT63DRAFT_428375 [Microthyrium microscopicum]|uniref:Uncharacterized protein n=1 Tax=Microthyrium microscopicum TaxID=703497 RepID=A0A6A6TZZ3_9PEZI|nr:hypothetical protein BT63DRAFT_428375 [Microthyrium microscopicum]